MRGRIGLPAVIRGNRYAQAVAARSFTPEQAIRIGEGMNAVPGQCAG